MKNWQNIGVGGKFIGLILVSVFVSLSSLRAAAQSSIAKDPEYKEMLDQLNRRYEGFFIHENNQKRWERQRRTGVDDIKKTRDAYRQKRENARKNFVRTPPPDMEPARLRWEYRPRRPGSP